MALDGCGQCKRPVPLNEVGLCIWCARNQDLPGQLQAAFEASGVAEADREAILAFLGPLKAKEATAARHFRSPTYEHSVRVGLLAHAIGKFMALDEKALLFAGLLHDIGKALVLMGTLAKTDNWTPADSLEMETHVTDGFRMLRGRFDFSAQVMGWHHRFQPNCYPQEAFEPLQPFSTGTNVTIAMYGRLLALADGFDAFHRVNFQDGQVRARSDEEIRALMLERNTDQRVLVSKLYAAGLFI